MSMALENATGDTLMRRTKAAMAEIPPEELTAEELRVLVPIVEAARDRRRRLENVVRLDHRRPRVGRHG